MFQKIKTKIKFKRAVSYGGIVVSSEIGFNSKVHRNAEIRNTKMGDHSYVGDFTIVNNTQVGDFCSIGQYCIIGLHKHPLNFVSTSPLFYSQGNQLQRPLKQVQVQNKEILDTVVEHDVWIGSGALVVGGLTLAQGTVIGAGSVVVKDTLPYGIYGGNPAKLIRKRFADDVIEKLIKRNIYDDINVILETPSVMLDPENILGL